MENNLTTPNGEKRLPTVYWTHDGWCKEIVGIADFRYIREIEKMNLQMSLPRSLWVNALLMLSTWRCIRDELKRKLVKMTSILRWIKTKARQTDAIWTWTNITNRSQGIYCKMHLTRTQNLGMAFSLWETCAKTVNYEITLVCNDVKLTYGSSLQQC